jgi:hypothetical protein
MKTSSVFWGLFFIFLGLIILLEKLNVLLIDYGNFFDYWPIIIILFGFSILNLPEILKKIIAAVAALLMALFVMSMVHFSWFPFIDFDDDYSTKTKKENSFSQIASIPFTENIKYSSLELNAGACSIIFKDSATQLIDVISGYPLINIDYSTKDSQNNVNILLDLRLRTKFFSKKHDNNVIINLNTQPIWDLDLDIGAVNMECDLSKYKIRDLCIDAGATDIDITLGNKHSYSYIEINSGASDFTINIPKESGCQIESSTGLSSEDFPGFRIFKGSYYTENFEKADNKIIIKISGGVSSFEVVRY